MVSWYTSLGQLVLLSSLFVLLQTQPGGRRVVLWLDQRVMAPLNRVAHRPAWAYGLVAGWTLLLLVSLSMLFWPHPIFHDEFSYQLAGDTFAHGRLVNPMHPLWRFFETFHVITNPFYAAKYPPGQGLFLALGQWMGNQVLGLWVAYLGGTLSVYYLLRASLPPVPALLTGLLTAAHAPLIRHWGLAFWCGALPMLGGSLALGAAIRLWRNPKQVRHVGALSVGVFVLLISRPYEGAVYALLPVGMLAVRAGQSIRFGQSQILVGWLPGIMLGVGLMGLLLTYNTRITGSPVRFPYSYYYERNEQSRPLLIQTEGPRSMGYVRPEMRRFHDMETGVFRQRQTLNGWVRGVIDKVRVFGAFYIGTLLMLPFLYALLRRKTPIIRLSLASAGLALLANLICTCEMPHYLAAATGALAVVVGWGMMGMGRLPGRWRVWGQALVVAICLSVPLATFVQTIIQTKSQGGQFVQWREFAEGRGHHETALQAQGGQHVILVHYRPDHDLIKEWVFNGADIDAQPVIWALDKGPVQNRALLRYYPNRHIWRLRPDTDARRLERLREGKGSDS